jgi:uncharacterized protein (TIGR03067 family)
MRKHVWLVLAAGLLIGADDTKKDIERLEGTWKFISVEANGMKLPQDQFKDSFLVIKGNDFTATMAGNTSKGTYKIDASKKPKTLDIAFTEGAEKGTSMQGIYEIEGDVYKVCFNLSGKGRPKEFSSKPDNGNVLEILHREKK